MRKILVDADACPTISIIEELSIKYNLEVIFICDTSHSISSNHKVIIVDKGADSVDFKLLSLCNSESIVVSQDYALASLCLLKKAIVIHPNGFIIDNTNIDVLLQNRYINQKARKAKIKTINPKKRTIEQDIIFKENLEKIIDNKCKGEY